MTQNPFESMIHSNANEALFEPFLRTGKAFPDALEKVWKIGGQSKVVQKTVQILGFNAKLSRSEHVEQYIKGATEVPFNVFLELMNSMRKFDGLRFLHDVECPTLIISGEEDLIVPPHNQITDHKLMPNSKFVTVPLGSHCSPLDRPGFVNHEIREFLKDEIRPLMNGKSDA